MNDNLQRYPKMKKVDLSNINPILDGVDHTRIDKVANTLLGRNLTIESHRVFHHPQYGSFVSVYTAIQWYKLKEKNDKIREMNGNELRDYLSELAKGKEESIFNEKYVSDAIMETFLYYSILSSPPLLELFLKNDKPFVAYYIDEKGKFKMRDKQMTRVLNKLKPKLVESSQLEK